MLFPIIVSIAVFISIAIMKGANKKDSGYNENYESIN